MIQLESVSKWYGAHAAVRDLDLTIERGGLVGLLGLNGAGKTTTLRMLVGLLRPTDGTIHVDGKDCATPEGRRAIGFLPDQPPLYDEMRVETYLRFAGGLRGLASKKLDGRIDALRERCGLREVIDAPIGTLSHGFRQRVGIAQALVHEPSVLVLDEPNQGLDPLQIVEMRDLIRSLRGERTVVLSSHILGEITKVCDRVVVLHEGRVATEGTSEELERRLGAHTLRLVARGNTEAIVECVSTLHEVDAVEVESTEPGTVALAIRTRRDQRAEISKAVVDGGFELLTLESARNALEATFAHLASPAQSERDE